MAPKEKASKVPAKKPTVRPSRSTKSKSAESTTKVTVSKKVIEKTKKELQELQSTAAALTSEVSRPTNLPEGISWNPRAFAPLPAGWFHAKKQTKASGRGVGGRLQRCFFGPNGQVKFHMKDVEKVIGYKFQTSEESKRPRLPSIMAYQKYGKDSIVRRTAKQPTESYIKERCDALNQKTVEHALSAFVFTKHSREGVRYTMGDLQYDIRSGWLTVDGFTPEAVAKRIRRAKVGAAAAKAAKVTKAAAAKAAKATTVGMAKAKAKAKQPKRKSRAKVGSAPTTGTSSSSSGLAAAKKFTSPQTPTPAAVPAPRTPAIPAPVTPAPRTPSFAPFTPAPMTPGAGFGMPGTPVPGAVSSYQDIAELRKILDIVFLPLKNQVVPEQTIYTLVGVGYRLCMDREMLGVLPSVLQRPPELRQPGSFAGDVMASFERELRKHV
eukprot:TRINITY_DN9992_c0_g1_i1.p1 TRINITY_DN9992_c0_g1~~TRINITY_DN9992_c0_g1_i1.p1  ORF type:complete len:437 (+),score=83.85 TRINITY_DN9992_c0_g1_i1:73-1383(+)